MKNADWVVKSRQAAIDGLKKARVVHIKTADKTFVDVTYEVRDILGMQSCSLAVYHHEVRPDFTDYYTKVKHGQHLSSTFSASLSELLYYLCYDAKVGTLYKVNDKHFILTFGMLNTEELFVELL